MAQLNISVLKGIPHTRATAKRVKGILYVLRQRTRAQPLPLLACVCVRACVRVSICPYDTHKKKTMLFHACAVQCLIFASFDLWCGCSIVQTCILCILIALFSRLTHVCITSPVVASRPRVFSSSLSHTVWPLGV